MKYFLITVLMTIGLTAYCQTPKSISEGVIAYALNDTLKKNDTVICVYYVKNIAQNARLVIKQDSLATGYSKTNTLLQGSTDGIKWYTIGSAIATAGADNAGSTTLAQNIYWDYLKVLTAAIDSAQYVDFKYRLILETVK